MLVVNFIFSVLLFISISFSPGAQASDSLPLPISSDNYKGCTVKRYTDCAAILFNGKLLVDEYSPRGTCKLENGVKGMLTVATVNLSDEGGTPVNNIGFKVAIKNDRTNTIWMYSKKTLQKVRLEDILKKCENGDRIIVMTVDQRYSLPHHEIELMWGC